MPSMAELEQAMAEFLHVKPKKPPIDNFPLPQELRDHVILRSHKLQTAVDLADKRIQIYEHLLWSVAVAKGTRYRFNTQLFGVNSSIKADAEKWLCHRHPFVLASYKWARLDPSLIDIIPKLSTNKRHIERMKHHSMHIHLSCGVSKQERRHIDALGLAGHQEPEIQWFLMLAEDLDVLAAVFDIALQPVCGPTVLVGCSGELIARVAEELGSKASVSFKLISTRFRTMNQELQRKLFDSLQGLLVGEGLKVKVLGDAVDPAEVTRLKRIISPSLVFAEAKKWAADRALRKFKWACDIDVDAGHDGRAFASYKAMLPPLPLFNTTSPLAINFISWPGLAASEKAHIASNITIYDCLVSAGWLALRTNNMIDFDHIVSGIIEHTSNNPGLRLNMCWNSGVGASHLVVIYSIHRHALFPGLTNQNAIDKITFNYPELFWIPQVTHDLALLRKQDPHALVTPESLPLDQCAARILPLHTRIFDSYPAGDPLPDGIFDSRPPKRTMIGWQNATALAKLSGVEKEAINEMQRSHKFAVTDFDSLPDIRRIHDEMIATAVKQHGQESFPVPLTEEQEAKAEAELQDL